MWSNSLFEIEKRHIYKETTEFEVFHWVPTLARFISAWSGE